MGSICLVMGTPYKEGVMGLSLDRSLDDMHHHPEDCLLIGTRLNDTQAAHPALKTGEALNQHCREMGIDESASNHAKMCAVFQSIIKGMIRRWPEIKAVVKTSVPCKSPFWPEGWRFRFNEMWCYGIVCPNRIKPI